MEIWDDDVTEIRDGMEIQYDTEVGDKMEILDDKITEMQDDRDTGCHIDMV